MLLGRVLAAVLAGALLVGCGGGDDNAGETASTDAATTAANGTTMPGTDLDLGKRALVTFPAGKGHQALVDLTVTSVKRGKVKDLTQFTLGDDAKSSSVYYVRVSVKSTGGADLGGKSLKMYGKVSNSLVVQPVTFGSTFARCDYQPLPKKFTKGSKAQVCMVMLAPRHGKISAVEWRGADAAEPISWAVR